MSERLNEFQQPIGYALPGWRGVQRPEHKVLQGKYCRLEPINAQKHTNQLYEAYSKSSDWRDWTYLIVEPFDNSQDYFNYLLTLEGKSDPVNFAIIDEDTERAIGTIALMRIDPANGVIEVGSITFSPQLKRTRVATEVMSVLLKYVFQDLGYRRFEWKCDSLNVPSRAAALRFGFTFEGIFRQAIVTHGRNRDTAWYSIIDSEFQKLYLAYNNWLSENNFDENGNQKKPLRDFMV